MRTKNNGSIKRLYNLSCHALFQSIQNYIIMKAARARLDFDKWSVNGHQSRNNQPEKNI